MDKEEIALQLTLKAIERMSTPTSNDKWHNAEDYNALFSNHIVEFYNNIYKKIEL